jgi:prefoldin subunit 5
MIAVQALERRNEDLNEQIDALTSRLEALERMVSVGR